MAIDFTKPATTDNYSTQFVPNIQNNIIALAQLLDSVQTTITGTPPTYAKRINRSSRVFEEYNGTAWGTFAMGYALKAGDTFSGQVNITASTNLGAIFTRASGNTVGFRLAQTGVVNWDVQNNAVTGNLSFVNNGATAFDINGATRGFSIYAPASGYALSIFGQQMLQAQAVSDMGIYLKGSATSGRANLVLQSNNGSGPAFWITGRDDRLDIGGTGGTEPSGGNISIISATGFIGLGTQSPGVKLDIFGQAVRVFTNTTSQYTMFDVATAGGVSRARIGGVGTANDFMTQTEVNDGVFYSASGNAWYGTTSAKSFAVKTANVIRMLISPTGLVSIGPNMGTALFEIQALSSSSGGFTNISTLTSSGIKITGANNTTGYDGITYQSGSGGGAAVVFSRDTSYGTGIGFYTNSTSNAVTGAITLRLLLTDAGNLSLGGAATAITNYRVFNVYNTVGGGVVEVNRSGAEVARFMTAWDGGANPGIGSVTAHSFIIGTSGVNRIIVNASGYVGIGKTPVGDFLLDLASNLRVGGEIRISAPGGGGYISGYNDNSEVARVGYMQFNAGADVRINAEQAGVYFRVLMQGVTKLTMNPSTGKLTVAAGASTVTYTQAFSATPTFDADLSNVFEFAGPMTANVTSCVINNGSVGQTISIRVKQGASAAYTFATPAGAKVAGSISTTLSSPNILTLTYSGADSRWEGGWLNMPA